MKYDVVIAGAGPAGCSAADYLVCHGFSTLVLEKNNNGHNPKSIFTLKGALGKFNLERTEIGTIERYLSLMEGGKRFEYRVGDENHGGCMVDDAALVREMRGRAQKKGADFRFGEVVDVYEGDGYVRVSSDVGTMTSKYLIDATGTHSAVGRLAGIVDDNPWAWVVYGKKFHGDFDDSTAIVLKGKGIGKSSWAVPRSRREADIVAADFGRLYNDNSGIRRKFENTVDAFKRLGLGEVGYATDVVYEGFIRVQPVKKSATKRIFLVGDAAGQGSPYTGDALRPALGCGKLLGELICAGKAHEYDKAWRGFFNYKLGEAIRNIKIRSFGNMGQIMDFENVMARQLSEEEMYEMLSTHRIKSWKVLSLARNPQAWPFLTKLAVEVLKC